MIYEYCSNSGERKQVAMRMNDHHPEKIVFINGEMRPVDTVDGAVSLDGVELTVYHRVYGNVAINADLVGERWGPKLSLVGTEAAKDCEQVTCVIGGVKRDNVPVVRNKDHAEALCAKYQLKTGQ